MEIINFEVFHIVGKCTCTLQGGLLAVRSLGGRADLSPAALRSPLVNQLNSLKIPIEFATSQGSGRCGSATLPASGGEFEVFYALITCFKYR